VPINPDACPGPCTRAARTAWAAYDAAVEAHAADMTAWLKLPGDDRPAQPIPPTQPGMPVTVGQPVWDPRCARTIRDALAELDDTAAILAAGIDGHRGAAMSGPNGTKPLDHKAVVDSLDELYGDLVEVEDQWRQARGYPARPRRARGAHARAVCVGWLLGQLDDLLLHPGSVEFGLSVLRWQRRLRAMAKVDPASKRSPIACPRCRERQVSRREDGYFECGCGRLLTQAEHDREYARQADEHDHEQQEAHA
jgi:ribosomal protein L37AE/L43A